MFHDQPKALPGSAPCRVSHACPVTHWLQVDAAFEYLLKSADLDKPDVRWVDAWHMGAGLSWFQRGTTAGPMSSTGSCLPDLSAGESASCSAHIRCMMQCLCSVRTLQSPLCPHPPKLLVVTPCALPGPSFCCAGLRCQCLVAQAAVRGWVSAGAACTCGSPMRLQRPPTTQSLSQPSCMRCAQHRMGLAKPLNPACSAGFTQGCECWPAQLLCCFE